MIKEIGSEFPLPSEAEISGDNNLSFLPEAEDSVFVFSGRTAIETVLKDTRTVKKALLPSYCCSSMIEPFLAAGIHVSFYEVNFSDCAEYRLIIEEDVDILLWCNYFGFHNHFPAEALSDFRKRGGIVIEDVTHSLLSEYNCHSADYFVASLRKWGSLVSGGYCAKVNGKFKDKPNLSVDKAFVSAKYSAMKLKSEYLLNGDMELKNKYLELFYAVNMKLSEDYSELTMDEKSVKFISAWDIDEIRRIRISNAKMIYRYLNNIKTVKPLFPFVDMDCPLFVPVLIDGNKRDSLRKKLIEQGVYCPVHWPKPDYGIDHYLYDCELSLICDQRYNLSDIKRMMEIICRF